MAVRDNIVDMVCEFVLDDDADFVSFLIDRFDITDEEIAEVVRKLMPEYSDSERAIMLDQIFSQFRSIH